MRKQAQSWRSNLWLLLFTLVFIFLGLEIAIRSYDAVRGRGFFSNHRNQVLETKSLLPFRTFGFELYRSENGVRYISSRHGELFPVRKPEGTFRIVVFGGSSSENFPAYAKERIHYPLILQAELRKALNRESIEVINIANSGYSTAHSLILCTLDVLSWKPDLIIVSHNINDLIASYWPDFTFDYSNKYSDDFFTVPEFESVYTIPNVLFGHSQFYWFVRKRIRYLTNETISLERKTYGYKPNPLATQIFYRNLRSFVALAKANDINVLLANQPLQPSEEYFVRHMAQKPYNDVVTYPLHEEFVAHHRAFNKIIEQVAEDTQALYLDNETELGTDKSLFVDFVHYTPEGVRVLANNYAQFLLRENVIQLSEAPKLADEGLSGTDAGPVSLRRLKFDP